MTLRDTSQSVRMAWLVNFAWGAGGALSGAARYTDWDNDLLVGSTTYSSAPEMQVTPAQLDGGVEDKVWAIQLAPTRTPADKLVRPYAWPTVQVQIFEFDPVTAEAPRCVFGGRLGKAIPNADGSRGMVKLELSGWKSLIQYPVGIETANGCNWCVYDTKTCQVNPAGFTQTASITAISAVTLSAPSLNFHGDSNWFTRGWLKFDGLTIEIRDSSGGASALTTVQLAPPELVGETATFYPGCDGLPSTCKNKFSNIGRYNGWGFFMPDHNPQIGGGGGT